MLHSVFFAVGKASDCLASDKRCTVRLVAVGKSNGTMTIGSHDLVVGIQEFNGSLEFLAVNEIDASSVTTAEVNGLLFCM